MEFDNIGNTISFENSSGIRSSIVVSDVRRISEGGGQLFPSMKESAHFSVEIESLPIDNWKDKTCNEGELVNVNQRLIHIIYFPKEDEFNFSFYFKDFSSTFNKCSYPERRQEGKSVIKLFWSIENGLVGYQTKDNDCWIVSQ